MLFWFAAFAVLGAYGVLRDARFDYRLIAVGALLPDVIDAPLGHRGLAHTLVFAVAALAAVMLVTVNRRPLRRHLIAVPIGFLAHLVLDFVWVDKSLFWWPFFGSWGATGIEPALPWLVVREVIGLGGAAVVVQRYRQGRLA